MNNPEIMLLSEKLKKNGIPITAFEHSFLEKTISGRMLASGIDSIHQYCEYLQKNTPEMDALKAALHISFSEFFRNPLSFACLQQVLLPILFRRKKKKHEGIRIWSAACANGQESYSLAILFDEFLRNCPSEGSFRIFATDINPEALAKAQDGIYPLSSLNHVFLKRLNDYFHSSGDTYAVIPELKKYIDFSLFDLLTERSISPPSSIYGDFDIVMCSNILFYYEPVSRRQILEKIYACLAPDGYVITGESEREILKENGFHEIFVNSAIFQKKR
jgi:chemotaxis methyl-accepting protein methylase